MQCDGLILFQPSAKKRKIEDEEPLHKTAQQNGEITMYCRYFLVYK